MKNPESCVVVVSGPAGVGKDSVVKQLRANHPEIRHSVSATTRAPRPGEQEGVNYYYVTKEQFEQMLAEDKILEHTCYCNNYYGTPREEIDRCISQENTIVLVIEVEGAANIKRLYPGAVTVFIMPPSMEVLENRLRGRGTETEEVIRQRLTRAKEELALAENYDVQVVNDTIDHAAEELYRVILAKQG